MVDFPSRRTLVEMMIGALCCAPDLENVSHDAGGPSMTPVRLSFDMADPTWFAPYETVEAEVDTNDTLIFYPPARSHIRIARMLHSGREFVLKTGGEQPMPWGTTFGGWVAILPGSSWELASQTNFSAVEIESVGKVVVTLLDRSIT